MLRSKTEVAALPSLSVNSHLQHITSYAHHIWLDKLAKIYPSWWVIISC